MRPAHIPLILFCYALFGQEAGYQALFNGRNLDGWDGDPRLWKAGGGVLSGSTEGVDLEKNTFLIYRKAQFDDFHLKLEVKLRNHNSGVQFRSEALDGWVVRGLQADMAEGNWWGSIYDEKGTRGVIVNGWTGKAEKVVRPGDWNDVEVYAKGGLVQVRVNGMLTAELTGETRKKGVVALQLHRGPAMEVYFRNIRLKELE